MVKIEHYTVLCRQRRIVNGLLAYNLQALLPLQAARATRFVSQNRYSWRRHTGNYCDDHCLPCSAESAPLPKIDLESILSTDSTSRSLNRFDRSTRLESTLSIDSTSALIDDRLYRFQGLMYVNVNSNKCVNFACAILSPGICRRMSCSCEQRHFEIQCMRLGTLAASVLTCA